MFRVQDNVPEVYINQSRDFQLISRLYDVLFSGVKYDIDSMVNVLDATLTKDSMLQLMCSKVGFFPRIEIDANVLKYIIASFPYILKYKGSRIGIQYAVNAILKAENNPDSAGVPYVDIHRKKISESDQLDEYTVYIFTTVSLYNKQALQEVLRYVIPVGMHYQLLQYNRAFDGANHPTMLSQHDAVRALSMFPFRAGSIRAENDNYGDTTWYRHKVGAFDASQVVSSQDVNAVNSSGGKFFDTYKGSARELTNQEKDVVLINQQPQLMERQEQE